MAWAVVATAVSAQRKLPFAKGADISWITQIEHNNQYRIVDERGRDIDAFRLLRKCGMNMVRLRVWVNPRPDRRDGRTWCHHTL